jgi:hypothetical protein
MQFSSTERWSSPMKWSRLWVRSRYFFVVLVTMVIVVLLAPARSAALLKEMEIQSFNPENTPIPVFTNYPEKAAIIVRSSMTNLQFESNLQIIAKLGSPAQGEYILIVDPVVQSIRVSAAGYLTASITIRGLPPWNLYSTIRRSQKIRQLLNQNVGALLGSDCRLCRQASTTNISKYIQYSIVCTDDS